MPTGKCNKCGEVYYGQALRDPKYRMCDKLDKDGYRCGGLIIVDNETEITIPQEV